MQVGRDELEEDPGIAPGVAIPDRPACLGGRNLTLEDLHQRLEHQAELFGAGLGQSQVLSYQCRSVGQVPVAGNEAEQPNHSGAKPFDWLGMAVHELAERRGTHPGVAGKQSDEKLVLAREAPVERLERCARQVHDLGYRERRPSGTQGESARRRDKAPCRVRAPRLHSAPRL